MSSALAFVLIAAAAPTAPVRPGAAAAARAEAYYHFSLGQQSRLSGELTDALEEYRKAVRVDPSSSALRTELARMLREAGQGEEAITEAQAAVRLDAKDAEAQLVLAQALHAQAESGGGRPLLEKAAVAYAAAVALRPTDAPAIATLAQVYGQLDRPADAAKQWRSYVELDSDSFDAQIQLGSALLAAGDAPGAAAALEQAVRLHPRAARAYQALGDTYAKAEQPEQAILNYRKALEIEPRNLAIRVMLGDVLLSARRYKEALAEADAILAGDEKNRHALDLQARAYRETRDFDRATAVVDRMLASDPRDLKAQYLAITVAEARRDFAGAADRIEKILLRNKSGEADGSNNDRVFLVHLGIAYQQLDRHREAADAFRRAAALGEPDPALQGQHVEALLLAKDLDTALTAVRAYRAGHKDDRDLIALEANVLRERGDVRAGEALIEGMRRQAPDDPAVLAQVADYHRRARQYTQAESALRDALTKDPKSLRVLFQLGAVLERQKRHDDAEKAFRDALAIDPESAPVLNYLGYMNADRNVRVAEAAQLIERALALDPENGAYLDSLGWAMYRLDRAEESEQYLRRAVAKEPGAVVYDHLGDVLERRHNPEAVVFWRKALEAEDEDSELDRANVERKIRDAGKRRGEAGQGNHP